MSPSGTDRLLTRSTVFMITAALLATIVTGCKKHEAAAPPPQESEVVAITVHPKTVPVDFPFVAQIQSSHQVDVMSRVSGFLEKISYQEGEPVKQGQVLFQLDKKPYMADADAAKAEVELYRSQLYTAKANLDRVIPLAEQNAASKKDLDDAIGKQKSAEASLQQAQAKYNKTLLDVSYTTITSPVSGVAGQALMREGAYIAAGGSSAKLTYVAKLDPAWVDFSISQNVQDRFHQEVVNKQMIPPRNHRYTVELELANGVRYPQTGLLNFSDPSFSKETGTYQVRAEIPNPKSELRPGMFVKAHLKGAQRLNAIAVPQRAVQQSANGHMVWVADDKNQAESRPVTAGDWAGDDWIITQGLKDGDRVIVDGFMKLGPGMPLKVISPGQTKLPRQTEPSRSTQPANGN